MQLRTKMCLLIATMMMLGVTQAFVCTNDYCQNVKCSKILTKESCTEHFIPNSSRCGCCPTCVTYIEPFGYCNEPNENSEPENFWKRSCTTGYVCARHQCSPLV